MIDDGILLIMCFIIGITAWAITVHLFFNDNDNLKLDIMAAIIAFLIFLSFCFGFFVAGLMAEEKRNEKTE